MWKTGDQEMATPKRVRTYRPKHSDTSLSREWRINVANKKKALLSYHKVAKISRRNELNIFQAEQDKSDQF